MGATTKTGVQLERFENYAALEQFLIFYTIDGEYQDPKMVDYQLVEHYFLTHKPEIVEQYNDFYWDEDEKVYSVKWELLFQQQVMQDRYRKLEILNYLLKK